MQEALACNAHNGQADEVQSLLEENEDWLTSAYDRELQKLYMAVATKAAATEEQDGRLKKVLEVFLKHGYAVTQPMLTACGDILPPCVNASRVAFLHEQIDQVCLLVSLKAGHVICTRQTCKARVA